MTQLITSIKTGTFTSTYSITNTATWTLTHFYTLTHTFTFFHTISNALTSSRTFTSAISIITTTTLIELVLKLSGTFSDIQNDTNNIVFWLTKNANVTIKIFTVSGENSYNK